MPTRRVIRKSRSRATLGFDEQLWPVNLALALLGGFSIGVTAAYLRFDDPRPLFNAWTSIVAIAMLTGAVMVGMRWINNRVLRRGMQFSIILAALLHLMFVLVAKQADVFGRAWTAAVVQEDLTRRREPVTVQDFIRPPREENEPVDFEQPVETETPSPEPEEVDKEEPQERDVRQPQPTPVAESQETPEPQPVERQTQQESAPRSSPTLSKLSRHRSERQIAAAAPSPNAESNPQQTASPRTEPQQVEVERTASNRSVERTMTRAEPTPSQPTAATARRAENDAPQVAEQNPQPAPSRRSANPQIAATPAPAQPRVSQRTADNVLAAAPTTPQRRQTTTSPNARSKATEVEPAQVAARQMERRRVESPEQPQTANSPQPTPTNRPRVTTRPDAALAAEVDSPNPNSSTPTATAQVQPQATQIAARSSNPSSTPQRSVEPLATPLQPTARPTRRSDDRSQPVTSAVARSTPRRRNSDLSPSPAVQTNPNPSAVTSETSRADVSAQSVAVTKQATTNEQAAPTEAASNANTSGAQANPLVARSSSQRRQAESNPVNESTAQVSRTRTRAARSAIQLTSPTAAASDRAPSFAQQSRIQASSASVARSSNSAPAAQDSATRSAATPTETASSRSTATAARRASATANPNMSGAQQAANSPARSSRSISIASTASPQNTANASSGAADARPTIEPSTMAMNRGQRGVAGTGGSPNMDRSSPAADTPSQVASSSARRRIATQDTPQGPSLRPQAPALTRNTRAMSQRNTSVFAPQAITLANASANSEVSDSDASASAAVEQALSNAENATITAAAGTTEVDLGPTRVVSESGAARSRSSGGGQPEIHADGEPQPTRRRSLGSPALVVAAEGAGRPTDTNQESGNGQPLEASVASSLGERSTEAEPTTASAGERSASSESASPSEASDLGAPQLARAELSEDLAEPASSGGEESEDDDEDEEKKRARRLAERMRGGGPQLAVAGARVTIEPAPAESVAGNGTAPPSIEASAAAGEVGRLSNNAAPAESAIADAGGGEPASTRLGDAQSTRAEVADGNTGAPSIGGGSPKLSRRSAGPAFAANNQAEAIAIEGQLASAGEPSGSPISASASNLGKQSNSSASTTSSKPTSGSPGESATGAIAAASATRASDTASGGGPQVASAPSNSLARRAATNFNANGMAAVVDVPSPGDIPVAVMEGPSARIGDQNSSIRRQAAGSIAVDSAGAEGPGGLGAMAALNAGINSRRAQRESMQVHTRPVRYLRKETGGQVSLNSTVVAATKAFAGRNPSGRTNSLGPQTEKSIELGLAFLARNQLEDGRWTLQGFDNREAQMVSDTAATGLSLLAFQGAGYHHKDYEYKTNCEAAIQYLTSIQKENGDLYVPQDEFSNSAVWLYSHGIAALALTEAYGMTQDPELREPAQKALNFIVYSQDPKSGGWRYTPQAPGDTSVTGWMMMALKSGQLAGLDVPDETLKRIDRWVDRAAIGQHGEKFRYNPDAPDTPTQRHGRQATTTMTAVGLLLRFYSGHNRDSVSMKQGAMYLLKRLPGQDDKSAYDARRDTYYWYYATQVMFHMKGEYWEKWNNTIRTKLLKSQVQQGNMAGSWDPIRPIPDRWGAQAGRLFVTTLNLLSLEVRFRHMPLNDFTGK